MKHLFYYLYLIILLTGCSSGNYDQIEGIDLKVTWELETNFAENGGHIALFTIVNNSDLELNTNNWELYWNMAPRTIIPESIKAPVTIEWINGDWFVMKPMDNFKLGPGDTLNVRYRGTYAIIKRSDAPLGLYSVYYSSDGSTKTFPVNDYIIGVFDSPQKINRGEGDTEPIPTSEWLFEKYSKISHLPHEELPRILPQPQSLSLGDNEYSIESGSAIHYDEGLKREAELLARLLNKILTDPVALIQSAEIGPGIIALKNMEVTVPESYSLSISIENGITISGDPAGVFYGTQSLIALIRPQYLKDRNNSIILDEVLINDEPAFAYRGMHLDVGRNFNSVETIKHLLDAMAFYKLNKFHFNLTEDEGWRIEIEELPELTEFGAFRGHNKKEMEFLQPSYGSGPSPNPEDGYGSGFYTREEFIDILQYAWDRHIEVIPEVNVPGHSRAAIMAMEKRYNKWMERGDEDEANRFRLIDPEDESKYRSAQWYTDNILCVCRKSAFTFITTVIDDIIEMYREAGVPITMFHTGGDEVPAGAWTQSPICEDYLKQYSGIQNPKNLQKVYFEKVNKYLQSKELNTGGWEEIAMNFEADGSWTINTEFRNSRVIPYVWNSLWGAEDLGNKLANAGYSVVLCNVTNFYFDLAYNKDPREPGLYWAGFVNTRDAFEFVPYDVFKSIKSSADGKIYTDADFLGKEKMVAENRKNVLGIQGQLWSETLKGQDMLEYYYLPKMLGLAERAWKGQAEWANIDNRGEREKAIDEAWNKFANTLGQREFVRLDNLYGGYNYRLAPPGAKIENMRLVANTAYPGMEVRYTTDGSDPTHDSPIYTEPVEVGSEVIKLSTFDSRGRTSLPTILNLK